MFVTILHRMAGSPEPKHPSSFTDVSKDAWYAQAVAWASENAIVSGYSSQLFGSGDLVTREQMCVLFARYLRQAGYSLPTKGTPAAFSDVPKISDWAKEDTLFCQSIGLMQGKPGNLAAPQANAVRAEGAVMFTRLIESIVGAQK
ncbi:MAG: S-layer homology domain-containing protein, partial [Pseudoflavonifractor sp.]